MLTLDLVSYEGVSSLLAAPNVLQGHPGSWAQSPWDSGDSQSYPPTPTPTPRLSPLKYQL